MPPVDYAFIAAAGFAAGVINTVVGSGTLVTFPTLLLLGIPPVTANVSSNLGILPGSLAGTWGYRSQLAGTRHLLTRLLPLSAIGSATGALLLLVLPPGVFRAIVPVLIGLGVFLVILGPRASTDHEAPDHDLPSGVLRSGVLFTGVYGGYFGAAQGIILMGILSRTLVRPLQQLNAIKNALAAMTAFVASIVFLIVDREDILWPVVLTLAVGSMLGGLAGARIGQRLSPNLLRTVIVVIGITAIVSLLTR